MCNAIFALSWQDRRSCIDCSQHPSNEVFVQKKKYGRPHFYLRIMQKELKKIFNDLALCRWSPRSPDPTSSDNTSLGNTLKIPYIFHHYQRGPWWDDKSKSNSGWINWSRYATTSMNSLIELMLFVWPKKVT